jgi:nucleotide-binding universal stress UspA family protein
LNASTNNSILVALNDSISSRTVVDFLIKSPFSPDKVQITLLHILRKPSAGEELMGKKFMKEQPERKIAALQKAKDRMVENGFNSDKIKIELVTEPYETVSDGIIDQFNKSDYDMVMIGRKKMSKAEEFVLGDPSVKLLRALDGISIVVVKSK